MFLQLKICQCLYNSAFFHRPNPSDITEYCSVFLQLNIVKCSYNGTLFSVLTTENSSVFLQLKMFSVLTNEHFSVFLQLKIFQCSYNWTFFSVRIREHCSVFLHTTEHCSVFLQLKIFQCAFNWTLFSICSTGQAGHCSVVFQQNKVQSSKPPW